VFSAFEVFYENALYKFTYDIDIDIDIDNAVLQHLAQTHYIAHIVKRKEYG